MRFLKAYLPVFLWMALIFAASTDLGSIRQTSRIIGPILRWFYPEVSEEAIRMVQFTVRKCGHMAGYAMLALLFWRARQTIKGHTFLEDWNWPAAGWIVLWCGLYAISDEFHQSFVSSRHGHVMDVGLDTAGAFLAVVAIGWLARRAAQNKSLPRMASL